MLDLVKDKVHDELRQGEAFAPFANDPNQYSRKFYIESYGCAMNFSDSEIVASILNQEGFGATKVPEGDVWLIKARIKYGDKDTTIPMPLEIKWAGDTPIITLTNLTIPGLGTFTSRVLIYDNRYAGTWQHGKAGGNLFGRIEKIKEEAVEAK